MTPPQSFPAAVLGAVEVALRPVVEGDRARLNRKLLRAVIQLNWCLQATVPQGSAERRVGLKLLELYPPRFPEEITMNTIKVFETLRRCVYTAF